MSENFDFDGVFAERDARKRSAGPENCLEWMRERRAAAPNDPAVALNLGICLREAERHVEAREVLSPVVAAEAEIPDRWFQTAVEYYCASLRALEGSAAAISFVFEALGRLPRRPQAARAALFSFAITELLGPLEMDRFAEEYGRRTSAFGFTRAATRKLYEICSAVDRLDFFEEVFRGEVGDAGERRLAAMLHETMDNECWRVEFEHLLAGGALAPFDAYRLALQAPSRLPAADAESALKRLVGFGEDHWPCLRPLGAFYEREGRLEEAIEAYRRASLCDLQAQGQSVDAIRCVDPEEVKISCIALCFNDAPLIESYCHAVMPHCDEIIVNDGGSTDGSVDIFERIAREANFPIHVIRDRQRGFRDRSIYTKDAYRSENLGGVDGFEADRRRTTTLMAASHEYILIADLDDYFPPFPNLKTIVAAAYGVDHFTGSKCELYDRDSYWDLYQDPRSGIPTLFRRHRFHVFAGISGNDEYLSRLDGPLTELASHQMTYLTKCYQFWHLKYVLDPRNRATIERHQGPRYSVAARADRPPADLLNGRPTPRAIRPKPLAAPKVAAAAFVESRLSSARFQPLHAVVTAFRGPSRRGRDNG
ncbi:hypothetical protein [Methylosinus sp. Ce-a6]|uniref:hypothetical protein n=1 Tax=Methylosinus sp. Ce-a6 TaxID=2172005 RepID=UPI00135C0C02|nr:hypothetical protein [Methylosinus sp. Ce-a6]